MGGRLRSGEAEWETARHPRGAVWILQVSASSLKDFLQYCFYTSFSPLLLLSPHLSPSLEPSQLCWKPECSNFPSGAPLIQERDTPYIAQIRVLGKKASLCWC